MRLGVVGVAVEDLLERDLAVQLAVERDEDRAQAALGVGPEDAEPLAVAGGGRRRVGAGPSASAFRSARAAGGMAEGGVDVGIAELRRGSSRSGAAGVECREALLGVAAVATEVLGGERLEQARDRRQSMAP